MKLPLARRSLPAHALLLPLCFVCLGIAAGASPQLAISKGAGSNMVISWFGETGASYQLQTNTNLGTWANTGAAVTGANATVNVIVSTTGKPRAFFRFRPDVITAVFTSATGVLTITGGALGNAITVSRNAAGNLLVNGGAVSMTGGTPTVANTLSLIHI